MWFGPSKILLTGVAVLGLTAASLRAAGVTGKQGNAVEFNRDIRPILSDNCFSCHGFDPKTRKAKLRLDTLEGATADHDGNKAITPGDIGKSEVWDRITSKDEDSVMPPPKSHKTLTDKQKQTIKKWIEQGAPYQQHWAFEPIKKFEPPVVSKNIGPIDAFLQDRLTKEGLKPSAEADRPTLIRRAAFALTGLPPTTAELDAFVADKSPDAYEKMVDRYMTSPRFGEEMARYWLDVARYADTHGLHLDNERQMWAYRDYVVNAFNKNKPFDQFTIEQLAGDLLPDAKKPNPTKEQLTATGFNRCNVTTSEGGSIPAEFVYRYAVDRTSTTANAWMGLTAGCAVCHDHKFDPLSTKEFYSLYAFFYSAADPGMDGNALLTQPTTKLNNPEQEKLVAAIEKEIAPKQKELDELTKKIEYTDPATITPKPEPKEIETVWFEDDFPKGGKVGNLGAPTKFVTASEGEVYSGARSLKRTDRGLAQDYFSDGAAPLVVPPSAKIFAYAYLDPKDPPKAVMFQFHTKGKWQHRAIWGDYESINFGKANTPEKVNGGKLPELGKWVKLEIPAAKLGLNAGEQITGYAFTQFGGTVYWDKMGVRGRIDAAADPAHSLTAWWKTKAGKDDKEVSPELAKLLKQGPDKVKKPEEIERVRTYYLQNICSDSKPQLAKLAGEIATIRKKEAEIEKNVPSTFIFTDLAKPRDAFVMIRGQYDKPGDKVEPSTPAFLPPMQKENPEGRATRLDLARWLVSPEHPLTARVTVNRFWQQFFGYGLVKSSGDFGSQGDTPSHPELLDYLAADFRDNGWDVKRLVKSIVMSQAFRQSSAMTPELLAKDPENRLLARGPRFRLDAEQIRDNALYVSGLINLQMGGPGVKPYQPPNIWEPVGFVGSNTRFYKQDTGGALYRRSIYTFLKRTAIAPFMSNFDGPSREASCTRREKSDTPLQALQLMNDVQHVEAARALAERMIGEGGSTPTDRITFAYRTVLSRSPDAEELKLVKEEVESHLKRYRADEASAKKLITTGESKVKSDALPAELAAYTLVANMILNLDETLNRN
jgi:hypothetical protein